MGVSEAAALTKLSRRYRCVSPMLRSRAAGATMSGWIFRALALVKPRRMGRHQHVEFAKPVPALRAGGARRRRYRIHRRRPAGDNQALENRPRGPRSDD